VVCGSSRQSLGATILALGLLPFLRGPPRDGWEWSVIIVRILCGSGTICSGLLDAGFANPIYDETGHLTDCRIWRLILSERHLQLVLMAPVMVVLLLVEFAIAYFAKQAYGNRVNRDLEQVNTPDISTTSGFMTTSSSNFTPPPLPHRYRIRRAHHTYRGVRI